MKTFFAVLAALLVAGCIALYAWVCLDWLGSKARLEEVIFGKFSASSDEIQSMSPSAAFAVASAEIRENQTAREALSELMGRKPFWYTEADRKEIAALNRAKEDDEAEQAKKDADMKRFSEAYDTPTPAPSPEAEPSATPEMTVAEYQAEAVKEFPELGVQGSQFNAMFTARYRLLKAQGSPILNRSDWPMVIANQVEATIPR